MLLEIINMEFGSSFTSMKPHELAPSGICSLDSVIGGGMAVGSLTLMSEDSLGVYADMYLKIFLAQGIVNKDEILFVSCDTSPTTYMKNLPQLGSNNLNASKISTDPLHIAWRYENNPTISSMDSTKSYSNSFIFKDKLSDDLVKSTNLYYWPSKENLETYEDLFDYIHNILKTTNNMNELISKKSDKSILRIGIHRLGSFFWKQPQDKLPSFLYTLRALLHHSHAAAMITFPKHLIKDPQVISRCEQASDILMELESFIDTDTNPSFSELNGNIRFKKFGTLNALRPLVQDPNDWAFKFNLKKIIVEKLRLPPESAASTQREEENRTFCGQTEKVLDF